MKIFRVLKKYNFLGVLLIVLVILAGCADQEATEEIQPIHPTAAPLSLEGDLLSDTLPPSIVEYTPADGQRMALSGAIEVVFNQTMDEKATAAAWTFTNSEGKVLKGEMTWEDSKSFQFVPKEQLIPGENYFGTFGSETKSLNGIFLISCN